MQVQAGHVLRALTLVALLPCGLGIYEAYHPPYSDAQIQASVVDTWDVHVFIATFIYWAMAAIAVTAVVIGVLSRRRRIYIAVGTTILVAGCGALVTYFNQQSLAVRVEAITDQPV